MKDAILEILMLSKFTKRREMLSQLIIKGFYITDRKMRMIVEEMIEQDHWSIQSSEKGYSLIQDEESLNKALSYLQKKAKSISIRSACLQRNFEEQKAKLSAWKSGEQITLFV